jgi:hypothetical protein
MVRGSVSEDERRYWSTVLKYGFVGVVAMSAALIAVQGGGTALQVGVVAVAGAAFGVLLLRYFSWMSFETGDQRRRDR